MQKIKTFPKIFDHSDKECACNESSASVYIYTLSSLIRDDKVCYVELLVWEYNSVEPEPRCNTYSTAPRYTTRHLCYISCSYRLVT